MSGKSGQGSGGAQQRLHEKVGRLVEILERDISARSIVVRPELKSVFYLCVALFIR